MTAISEFTSSDRQKYLNQLVTLKIRTYYSILFYFRCSSSIIFYNSENSKFRCVHQKGKTISNLGNPVGRNEFELCFEAVFYLCRRGDAICVDHCDPVRVLARREVEPCSIFWFLSIARKCGITKKKIEVFSELCNQGFVVRPASKVSVFYKESEFQESP